MYDNIVAYRPHINFQGTITSYALFCRPTAQKVMENLQDLISVQEDPYSRLDEKCTTRLDLVQLAKKEKESFLESETRHRADELRVS